MTSKKPIIFLLSSALLLGGCSQGIKDSFQDGWKEAQNTVGETNFNTDDQITEDLVMERVKTTETKSLAMTPEEVVKIDIQDDASTDNPDDKIINVHYRLKSDNGGAQRQVKATAQTAVYIVKSLMAYKNVSTVNIWLDGDFIDASGNKSEATAVRVGIERATAGKTNWDNVEEQVVTLGNQDFIFNLADNTYIHPAIQKEL